MKRVPTSETLDRFRRALVVGNPVTIKLAQKELVRFVPKMAPVDLVNCCAVATGADAKRHGIDAVSLVEIVLKESQKREYEKFNGRDFAVLLTALGKLPGDHSAILKSVMSRIVPKEMRTTDMCMCLFALTKLGSLPAELFYSGMRELDNRIEQLNKINLTQLLFVVAKNTSLIRALKESEQQAVRHTFERILQRITASVDSFDNAAISFALYTASEASHSLRLTEQSPSRTAFFQTAAEEVLRRTDLSPKDVVSCVRALGRVGMLDQQIVQQKLVPILDSLRLSEEQIKGLRTALESIQYPLPPVLAS